MTIEGNDNPTNREETAEAGTPDQPSTMPHMSPPTEAGRLPPPGTPRPAGWATALRVLALFMIGPVILGPLVIILAPVFRSQPTGARRVTCLTNLRSISTACLIYAAGNRGLLPTEPSSIGSGGPEEGQTCVVGKNGLKSDSELWETHAGKPVFMGSGSNPRQYFRLLGEPPRKAALTPKQFICPNAGKSVDHRPEGPSVSVSVNGKETPVYDFNGNNSEWRFTGNPAEMTDFSYSFQVATEGRDPEDPNEIRGGGLSDSRDDPRKALVADRNPYSNEIWNQSELVAGQYGTGTYVYSPGAKTKFAAPPAAYNNLNDLMGRNANSRNHNQDGQMVAYLDGHGKWNTTSLAGADGDCIWMTLDKQGTGPRIPLAGMNYGLMRSKKSWATDSLLIP